MGTPGADRAGTRRTRRLGRLPRSGPLTTAGRGGGGAPRVVPRLRAGADSTGGARRRPRQSAARRGVGRASRGVAPGGHGGPRWGGRPPPALVALGRGRARHGLRSGRADPPWEAPLVRAWSAGDPDRGGRSAGRRPELLSGALPGRTGGADPPAPRRASVRAEPLVSPSARERLPPSHGARLQVQDRLAQRAVQERQARPLHSGAGARPAAGEAVSGANRSDRAGGEADPGRTSPRDRTLALTHLRLTGVPETEGCPIPRVTPSSGGEP